MNIIALIQCIICLIIAASQYQEFIGFCLGANKELNLLDFQKVIGVDNKETCLRECLLVGGGKGCQYHTTGCFAIKVEVSGGDVNSGGATCWKFSDTGKSQYRQKQDLS